MIAACGNATFSLKKKATSNATQHWAQLTPMGNATIQEFYRAIEAVAIHSPPTTHPTDHPPDHPPRHGTAAPPPPLSNGYLHDQPLQEKCPALLDDIIVPPWFTQDLMQRTPNASWTNVQTHTNQYWRGYRNYWPSLFVGPGRTTMSYLHADWCDTHAWMGLMQGRKHWRIVPFSHRPLLHESSTKTNTFPTDVFHPNYR